MHRLWGSGDEDGTSVGVHFRNSACLCATATEHLLRARRSSRHLEELIPRLIPALKTLSVPFPPKQFLTKGIVLRLQLKKMGYPNQSYCFK